MQAVKQTQGMQAASGQSGFNIIPFREIKIPEVFSDDQIEGLTKVLEIRKYLMDRQIEIEKLEGVKLRRQAEVLKLQRRLIDDESLGHADVMDVQGRITEATARLRACNAKIEQYQLEMLVQGQRLKG